MRPTLVRIVSTCALLAVGSIALPLRAATFNVPPDPMPSALSFDDVLNLGVTHSTPIPAGMGSFVNLLPGGGFTGDFTSFGVVNSAPGSVGIADLTINGRLNAQGGTFSGPVTATGALVNVNGGNLAGGIGAANSTIDFFSGFLGAANLSQNSVLNVRGLGATHVTLDSGSILNISGGGLAPNPQSPPGATILDAAGGVNLMVRSATIDGSPILGLDQGPVTVTQRGVDLEAILADGTPFTMPLSAFGPGAGQFVIRDSGAVTVTLLVPEPTAAAAALALLPAIGLLRNRNRGGRRLRLTIGT
jgi:hypothetical protein